MGFNSGFKGLIHQRFLTLPNFILHHFCCSRLTSEVITVVLEKAQIKMEHGVGDWNSVPWLSWLVAGFSPGRPGFNPRPVRVGFGMGEVVLGRIFLRAVLFYSVSIIPPVLCTRSFIDHRPYTFLAVDSTVE